METIDYSKTKLARSFVSSHVYEIVTNLTLASGIISILLAFAPVALGIIFVGYAFIALTLSMFIVIITLGLVFVDQNNILFKLLSGLWKSIGGINFNSVASMQGVGLPIIIAISSALLVITFIFTCVDKNRISKTKPIIFMIVTLILTIITLLIYILSKGGAQ